MAEARRRELAREQAQLAQQAHDKNNVDAGTGNKLIKAAKAEQNATRADTTRDATRNRTIQIKLPPKAPLDKRARFLRQLHVDACGIFGTVLGPEANQAHANHYHFDLAPRRRSAYCE